jgi:YD repeat-containing protein
MADNFIRDREGRIIGREDRDGWLRDGTGNLVARVESDGRTHDREGKIVGSGDQRLRELQRRKGS